MEEFLLVLLDKQETSSELHWHLHPETTTGLPGSHMFTPAVLPDASLVEAAKATRKNMEKHWKQNKQTQHDHRGITKYHKHHLIKKFIEL